MKRRAWWARGWIWMGLQVAAVATWYLTQPGFDLILRNDSRLYVKLARQASLTEIFGSIRTAGYPLFLRSVEGICAEFSCLPLVQLLLYGMAAVLLCASLERFGLTGWAAFAATTPLLHTSLVPHLAPSAMTEIPAAAFALIALSALLRLAVGAKWPPLWWLLFGLCLFAAYQIRPAFLFLLPLLPFALWLWSRWSGRSRRPAYLALVIAFLPLLLFCLWRGAKVGHFGLVAFTGHNISGIAASMLDESVLAALPEEDHELGAAIHAVRLHQGLEPVSRSSPFPRWQEHFIRNSWKIGIPMARKQWRETFADSPPTLTRDLFVDQRLTRLSLSIIKLRPGLYATWLARAWLEALRLTLLKPWIWGSVLALLVSWWLTRRRSGAQEAESRRPAVAFLAFAASFYLASLALVLLVEPPEWRYLTSAELLLPGGLLGLAAQLWVRPAAR